MNQSPTDPALRAGEPQTLRAAAELTRLSTEFPAFSISTEPMADNAIRFVARNRHPDVHPRTVVTSDAAELRAALVESP
jgi:hypothetical protein